MAAVLYTFILFSLVFSQTSLFAQDIPLRKIGATRPLPTYEIPKAYQLRIVAYHEYPTNVNIILSNGTVWEYIKKNPLRLGWLVGDDITIEKDLKGSWVLQNTAFPGAITVEFSRLAKAILPTISSIGEAGKSIQLDDGSEWSISMSGILKAQTWSWRPGDRIIVSPISIPKNSESYRLINLDREMLQTEATLDNA